MSKSTKINSVGFKTNSAVNIIASKWSNQRTQYIPILKAYKTIKLVYMIKKSKHQTAYNIHFEFNPEI